MSFKSGCILLLTFIVSQQQAIAQHVLNGKVQNAGKEPLIGATIIVKGTTSGTTTDIDGNFLLEIRNPQDTLQIRFQGYHTLEVLAGKESKRVFELEFDEEQSSLDEVVVVGFGTQKKLTVTGSVASISTREIQQVSTPSLSNAISGRMPGIVSRQSSGMPGSDAAQVFIRGVGTTGNRDPLILVDGIERNMNDINAQEVESFTILKDASATAVFGVRGANGVIMITTKKGTVGRPRITLRSETAMLSNLRMADYIDGHEYASLINEGLANVGRPLQFTEDELRKFADGSEPYLYPSVNWQDVVLKKHTSQHISNLSVSGGTDVIRYYTNVGYTHQDGVYKQDNLNDFNTNANMKRYNFRSNVDINLAKNLKIDLSLGGIIHHQNYPGNTSLDLFTAIKRTSPIDFPLMNPDGSLGGVPSYVGYHPYGIATQSGYMTYFRNTLQGTFGTAWDLSELITPGLSVGGRFAYDYYSFNQATRQKYFEVRRYQGVDENTGEEKYQLLREEQPMGYLPSNVANRAIYTEASVNYDRDFDGHHVTGMLLYNQRDYVNLMASNSIGNLPARRLGLAARVSYSYQNKYLLETNMGYNGSENFPKGKRFGFFPSVSAGWVISNEDFWNQDIVNSLKIRGSYGQVGNDQIGGDRFLFLTNVARVNNAYRFGDQQLGFPGFSESKIGNPDVTWEVSTKTNLGVDLELLSGKISLQLDGFTEKREGILMQRRTIPAIAGIPSSTIPYANLGKVDNKGFDALMEFKHTTSSGWYYSFRGNFTFARNKIVENDEPIPLYPYQNARGQAIPVSQPAGLVALGLFRDQEEIDNSPVQTFSSIVRPGDIKYKDINGDGVIDTYDRIFIGYPRLPEIMFGFGGTIAYKAVDVSVYFTGATRTSIYLYGAAMQPFINGLGADNITREYYDNRWTPDNMDARYPAVRDASSPNNFQESTLWQRDASYLRLRNVEVGYNFQPRVLERLRINGIRAFVNGVNLFTWDKLNFIDPESDNGTGGYPIQRILNAGVQFTF
ncbi:TonB-dependent receptor [Sphingobacterium chuzhouense]|uniref:TonB-dependent receptor n=2 Tax=Sphingobacterium chuzhouense TaxID=1742264 RepID=A0ABR7XNZ9_9SPHI|nr:TonB-dependent receptor [Sphingobacterium chuzhouense]